MYWESDREHLMNLLSLKDREHFRKSYLLPALESGMIEMTILGKHRSSKQKYKLTEQGKRQL
jgi:ATP-dependent DNA helicase RecG